jgi:hypothetical protein
LLSDGSSSVGESVGILESAGKKNAVRCAQGPHEGIAVLPANLATLVAMTLIKSGLFHYMSPILPAAEAAGDFTRYSMYDKSQDRVRPAERLRHDPEALQFLSIQLLRVGIPPAVVATPPMTVVVARVAPAV